MSSEPSVKLIEDWRERWEPVNKGKYSVVAVYETGDGIEAVVNEPGHGLLITTESDLVPIPQPKKLRPWKREEVPVGSVVRNRDGDLRLITGATAVAVYLIGWNMDFDGEQKGRSVKLLKKKLDMQLRSIG